MQLNERQVLAIAEAMVGEIPMGNDDSCFQRKSPELYKALETLLGAGHVPNSDGLWSILVAWPAKPAAAIPSRYDIERAGECEDLAAVLLQLSVTIGKSAQAIFDRQPKEGADVQP